MSFFQIPEISYLHSNTSSLTLFAIIYNSLSIIAFLSPFHLIVSPTLQIHLHFLESPLYPRQQLISVTDILHPHLPVIILIKFMCYGSEFLIITEYLLKIHECSLGALQKLGKLISFNRPCRRSLKPGKRSKMQRQRLCDGGGR